MQLPLIAAWDLLDLADKGGADLCPKAILGIDVGRHMIVAWRDPDNDGPCTIGVGKLSGGWRLQLSLDKVLAPALSPDPLPHPFWRRPRGTDRRDSTA